MIIKSIYYLSLINEFGIRLGIFEGVSSVTLSESRDVIHQRTMHSSKGEVEEKHMKYLFEVRT
jgi:hypothetical protein